MRSFSCIFATLLSVTMIKICGQNVKEEEPCFDRFFLYMGITMKHDMGRAGGEK